MADPHPFLPYAKQNIDASDIEAVAAALQSDWLTTGPLVDSFEEAWAKYCEAKTAAVVANGTAALHLAVSALGIKADDLAVVTPMTFVASVNCLSYVGAEPLFADVDPRTLLIDPDSVRRLVEKYGERIKAVIAVDYAGQPCDYDALRRAAPGIPIIADACHSPGALYKGRKTGTLADVACFSFHPVKHLTTGEGGAVVTNDLELAARVRRLRNHGIDSDHRMRAATGEWFYDMQELGFNYRLTDFQCALGLSQLRKLPFWLERRSALAKLYGEKLAGIAGIEPLTALPENTHAWHLYVIRVASGFAMSRDAVFSALRAKGIGVNVHYRPVHLHSFYRERFGTGPGLCPRAEAAGEEILSLPLWPGMREEDVERVVSALADMGGD